MASAYLDLFIDQGEDFSATLSLSGLNNVSYNLDTYTARSEIKRSAWSANTTTTFNTTIVNNEITLSLSSANTILLTKSSYSYDIMLTNSETNITSKILEGMVYVTPSISI